MLAQKIEKTCTQRKGLGFQKWRQYALAMKALTAHDEMRGLINIKIIEINRLKCIRMVETIKRVHVKQQRQALKTLLDHATQNRINCLVETHQFENIKALNRIHASYKFYDVLTKRLYY